MSKRNDGHVYVSASSTSGNARKRPLPPVYQPNLGNNTKGGIGTLVDGDYRRRSGGNSGVHPAKWSNANITIPRLGSAKPGQSRLVYDPETGSMSFPPAHAKLVGIDLGYRKDVDDSQPLSFAPLIHSDMHIREERQGRPQDFARHIIMHNYGTVQPEGVKIQDGDGSDYWQNIIGKVVYVAVYDESRSTASVYKSFLDWVDATEQWPQRHLRLRTPKKVTTYYNIKTVEQFIATEHVAPVTTISRSNSRNTSSNRDHHADEQQYDDYYPPSGGEGEAEYHDNNDKPRSAGKYSSSSSSSRTSIKARRRLAFERERLLSRQSGFRDGAVVGNGDDYLSNSSPTSSSLSPPQYASSSSDDSQSMHDLDALATFAINDTMYNRSPNGDVMAPPLPQRTRYSKRTRGF
jgi:hypothetical protein